MTKLHIKNTHDTIIDLINSNKSICRFGDGEFRWLLNDDNESFQRSSKQLSNRLKQVLLSNNKNILIGLPGAFNNLDQFTEGSRDFWKLFFAEYGKKIIPYLSLNKQYYDANISRLYIDRLNKTLSSHYFNLIKKLWDNKNVLIIEGTGSRLGVGNKLFNNVSHIYRIECPNENAFEHYNKILFYSKRFLNNHKHTLILIALGPTATILAYDLALDGYRAIDIGNIDLEYEWYLLGVHKKVNIPDRFTIEVKNGTKMTSIAHDKKYNSEIVNVIK